MKDFRIKTASPLATGTFLLLATDSVCCNQVKVRGAIDCVRTGRVVASHLTDTIEYWTTENRRLVVDKLLLLFWLNESVIKVVSIKSTRLQFPLFTK